jgi:LysM repeat protein
MRNKLRNIKNQSKKLGLFAIFATLAVSCANKNKTASANNPYTSNPYYSTGNSSSTASSSGTGAASYPSYDDTKTYAPTPPAENSNYPGYTGGNSTPYPSYTGNSTPAPVPATNTIPAINDWNTGNGTPAGASTGGAGTHTVAKGENLYRISLKYGTTVGALQSANGLSSATIHPGQVLRIP